MPILTNLKQDGSIELLGHMARANPQWKHFQSEKKVTVIFHGPHTYVTPSWYIEKLNVPTWNYIAVHAYGKARVVSEAGEMRDLMRGLVDRYEGGTSGDDKYTLESLPAEFLESQMHGIVGVEILVDEIQASFKLSQNRDEKNYKNVIAELSKSDDQRAQAVARMMSDRRCPKP